MSDIRGPNMTTFYNPSRASWRFIIISCIFTTVFRALLAPPSRSLASCLMKLRTVAFVEVLARLDLRYNYNGDA